VAFRDWTAIRNGELLLLFDYDGVIADSFD